MTGPSVETGFAEAGTARLYYEVAGEGRPFVMLHAYVADNRQWTHEFDRFGKDYRVIRYDARGFGKSEPVDGEYTAMGDLIAVLDHLKMHEPLIIMGCSMGGSLALDFALADPSRVAALIMVSAGASGLELDVPPHPLEAEVEKAFEAGDLDRAADLDVRMWFDGQGRTPEQVDAGKRALAYEMDRLALTHEAKRLGTMVAGEQPPAADRLSEAEAPVLIVVGAHDEPFTLAAADYMAERLPRVQKATIEDGAHLCNMDQPDEFYRIVKGFLDSL